MSVNAPAISISTPLHQAAHRGDLVAVIAEASAGADLNLRGRNGNRPLHLAVASTNLALVAWLLDHGADLHARNSAGLTALHWAAESGNLEMVRALIAAGARIDVRGNREFVIRETPSALYLAIEGDHGEVAAMLLEAGADPNLSCNSSGATALSLAGRRGQSDLVALLLAHGARANGLLDLDPAEPPYELPLACAASGEIARRLLAAGARTDARNRYGDTPLLWLSGAEADDQGQIEALAAVLEADADPLATGYGGVCCLQKAGCAAVLTMLERALAQRLAACPQLKFVIRQQRQRTLWALLERGDEAALPILLACISGPEIHLNDRNEQGRTPLQVLLRNCLRNGCSARAGEPLTKLVRQLQSMGADLDAVDHNGDSALLLMFEAAKTPSETPTTLLAALTEALLQAGADPNVENDQGCRALDLATDPALRRRLREFGAMSGARHWALFELVENNDSAGVSDLLADGVALESRAAMLDDTPWLFAARRNRPQLLGLFADLGANQRATAPNGNNAWHLAAESRAIDSLQALIKLDAPSSDDRDRFGCTPLMRLLDGIHEADSALRPDLRRVAVALVVHGANPTSADAQGRNALDRATSKALRAALLRAFTNATRDEANC